MGHDAVKEVTLLDEAVARDPAFVPALCLLTRAHLQAYWYGEDHTPARLELARKALEAAARLQPDSGDVHLSRALFHYWGSRAYPPALTELALAANSLPNDAEVLFYIATIQRREGRWDEAIKTTDRALVLDPRNGMFTLNQSWTYRMLRRYDDARRVIDNLLAWKTEDVAFQLIRAEVDLEEKADLTPLQEILSRELPASTDHNVIVTYRLMLASFQRDYRAAEKALAEHGPWEVTHGFSTPREYFEGLFARGRGEPARAATAFLRARERAAAPVTARPDDAKALIVLAKVDAKLGRKEEAVREAERAVELLPVSTDAFDGPLMLVRLANVYAEVGEMDRAIEVLQQAAALPGGPSYGILQIDAEFDPVRSDPRFQKIVASLAPTPRR
jgi:tetratricopeptide (TPR) repeat protein